MTANATKRSRGFAPGCRVELRHFQTENVLSAISSTANSGAFAVQLIDAFLAGGWTFVATIAGGQTLQGLSPQGYLVWCDVWASNSATVSVMLHSAVGSGCVGFAHQLEWDPIYSWQAIIHPCGGFISRPAVGASVNGSSCMFGIPMVAAGCGLAAALGSVSEVWFSFGDFANSPFFYGTNPRICIGAGDAFFAEDTTILTAVLVGIAILIAVLLVLYFLGPWITLD
jgi:hypothetical protein